MESLKISIPKPCHENWLAMTAAAQGRFCSSCSKTVIDFSDKSASEISKLISDHDDKKLCGRFRNDQLTEAVKINISIDAFKQNLKPFQAFAMALLLAFGTTLFSCTTPQGNVVGELTIIQQPDTEKVKTIETVCVTMGSVITLAQTDTKEDIAKTKGDVKIMGDTVQLKTVEVSDKVFSYDSGMRTTGLICISPTNENTITDESIDTAVAKTIAQTEPANPLIRIYPNPSSGIFNLKLNFDKDCSIKADLFDIKGSHIRTILPQQLIQTELKEIKIDLSEQPPGMYLINVITDEKIFTERVVISR